MNLRHASTPDDIATVRVLFLEYANSLGIDLGYQGFEAELAQLPGAYASPSGRLLLASDQSGWLGCAALRPMDGRTGEMKRLYVRPAGQGKGVGRQLAEAIIYEARVAGYASLRLDTLPTMSRAIRLYESLGFTRREPYFPSPIEGNVFMELAL